MDNLRNIRKAAGLSQQTLADRCGIHQTAVSKLERGRAVPTYTTALRLALALGVEVEDLAAPAAPASLESKGVSSHAA
jgi:transcriptional regulator with XRE-family HTH domain